MISSVFTRSFLMLFSGPIVWAVHFLFIYGYTGVICARPGLNMQWLGISVLEWGIGVAGLAAIALLAFIHLGNRLAGMRENNAAFLRWAGVGLALLSVLAIVLETLPIFIVPACA